MDDIFTRINAELARFDLEDGDLDAWPVADAPEAVALADLQQTTCFQSATAVLTALQGLEDGASWDDIWHALQDLPELTDTIEWDSTSDVYRFRTD